MYLPGSSLPDYKAFFFAARFKYSRISTLCLVANIVASTCSIVGLSLHSTSPADIGSDGIREARSSAGKEVVLVSGNVGADVFFRGLRLSFSRTVVSQQNTGDLSSSSRTPQSKADHGQRNSERVDSFQKARTTSSLCSS